MNQLDSAVEKLDEAGPATVGGFRRTLFMKQMQKFKPNAKRFKQRMIDRANKKLTQSQRRERTLEQERKAHRRFEVAVGLRKDTTPLPIEYPVDVSFPEKGQDDGTQPESGHTAG